MAAKTSTIRVNVIGDSKSAQKALRDVAGVGANTQKQLSSVTAGIAAGFTAHVLPAVMSFAGGFKTEATAIQSSARVVDMVFKDSAGTITSWAGDAVDSLGMTTAQAQSAAASFGRMFTGMGYSTDQAAQMSQTLVGLSADIMAVTGGSVTAAQAQEAMAAAFRGEYDALQRVIPSISAAAIEQKAMAMTGKQNASALTFQEKAAATYALILEGTNDIQGYFAQNTDLAAVRAAKFDATLKELQGNIGTALLPAMTGLLGVLTPVAALMSDNADAVAAFGVALATAFAANKVAGWVGALTAVNTQTLTLRQSARLMNTTTVQLQSSMAKLAENINNGLTPSLAPGATRAVGGFTQSMKTMIASALSPTNLALMGVTVGVGLLVNKWMEGKQKAAEYEAKVKAVTAAYFDQSGALDLVSDETARYLREQSRFAEGNRNQIDDLGRIGVGYQQLAGYIGEGRDGFAKFTLAALEMNEVVAKKNNALVLLNQLLGDTSMSTDDLMDSVKDLFGGNTDLLESFVIEQKLLNLISKMKIQDAANSNLLTEAERAYLQGLIDKSDETTNFIAIAERENDLLSKATDSEWEATRAKEAHTAAINNQIDALRALHAAMFGSMNVSLDIDNAFSRFNDTMKGLNESTSRGSSRNRDYAQTAERVAEAQKRAENAAYSHQQALKDLEEAQRGVEEAQKALDEALKGPSPRDRQEADMDLKDAQLALEDAIEHVIDAQAELTAAQAEGDPSKIRRAQNDYEQALLARERAQLRLNDAQEAYNEVANWTAQNDPKVAAAQDGVRAANDRLEAATRSARDRMAELESAQRAVTDAAGAAPGVIDGASSSVRNHRDRVLEARNAYRDLTGEIVRTMETIIAMEASAAAKRQHIDAIQRGIVNNPYLTQDQKNRLLLLTWDAEAKIINKERYSSAGGIEVPFAEGGLVRGGRGGVNALIGEKSHDELVLPLTKDVLSKLGGGGATYNITVGSVRNDDDLRKLEALLVRLQRQGSPALRRLRG